MSVLKRIHDVSPRDTLDRTALLLAFLLGVGGTAFLKLGGIGHVFWSAGWAALVLLAYAFCAWSVGRVRIDPEAIGDNCYYLGFLLTLSSLALTLYQLHDSPDSIVMRDVISGFGVALSSTILGVFLRVWLMQIRVDMVAHERETRAELHQTARELRTALSSSTAEIKAYTIESLQSAAEREARLRAAGDEAMEANREEIRALGEAVRSTLEKNISEAAREVTEKTITGIGERLSTDASRSIEAISASFRKISGDFAELRESERAVSKELMEGSEAVLEQRRRLAADMKAMTESIARVPEDISEITGIVSSAAEEAGKRMLGSADSSMATITSAADGLNAAIAESTRSVDMTRFRMSVETAASKITDSATALERELAGLSERLSRSTSDLDLESTAASLQATVKNLEILSGRIEKAAPTVGPDAPTPSTVAVPGVTRDRQQGANSLFGKWMRGPSTGMQER